MRLVEFDGHKFADDVAAAVKAMKHGQHRVLRYTGISHSDSMQDCKSRARS
jgi:hypothetical protein